MLLVVKTTLTVKLVTIVIWCCVGGSNSHLNTPLHVGLIIVFGLNKAHCSAVADGFVASCRVKVAERDGVNTAVLWT